MPDVMTDRLLAERLQIVQRVQGVQQTAAEEGRDLNDAERTTLMNQRTRLTEVDAQLELTTHDYALNAETAANIARFTGQQPEQGDAQWRSAGECLWDFMHQREDQSARRRVQAFQRRGAGAPDVFLAPSWAAQQAAQAEGFQTRAAQHMGTTAAATTPTAGGFGGLLVNPVIGPVIQLAWTQTPLTNAIGTRPAPNGWGFSRPRIVDPDLYTASQPQGLQKAELSSKKFDIVADQVTLTTVGNYLNLSLQSEAFINSPDALDIVVAQLNARTSVGIELATVGIIEGASKVIPLADDADSAAVLAAIYEGAAAVFTATGLMPTWLAMGAAGWARLGSTTDLAGRAVFPAVGAVNANGTANAGVLDVNVPGFRTVVTPGITDDSFYMGNGIGVELYVHHFPMLQAVEPSVLGRQIAVAAALGSYQPPTTEAGPGNVPPAAHEAIVKIGN